MDLATKEQGIQTVTVVYKSLTGKLWETKSQTYPSKFTWPKTNNAMFFF